MVFVFEEVAKVVLYDFHLMAERVAPVHHHIVEGHVDVIEFGVLVLADVVVEMVAPSEEVLEDLAHRKQSVRKLVEVQHELVIQFPESCI